MIDTSRARNFGQKSIHAYEKEEQEALRSNYHQFVEELGKFFNGGLDETANDNLRNYQNNISNIVNRNGKSSIYESYYEGIANLLKVVEDLKENPHRLSNGGYADIGSGELIPAKEKETFWELRRKGIKFGIQIVYFSGPKRSGKVDIEKLENIHTNIIEEMYYDRGNMDMLLDDNLAFLENLSNYVKKNNPMRSYDSDKLLKELKHDILALKFGRNLPEHALKTNEVMAGLEDKGYVLSNIKEMSESYNSIDFGGYDDIRSHFTDIIKNRLDRTINRVNCSLDQPISKARDKLYQDIKKDSKKENRGQRLKRHQKNLQDRELLKHVKGEINEAFFNGDNLTLERRTKLLRELEKELINSK